MAAYSDEFNQILRNCRDRNYIIRNTHYLRAFFDAKEGQELLAASLTTANSPIALKLIDILELDVALKLVVNQHTYASLYWLYRRGRISPEHFEQAKRQFRTMDAHEQMFEDTESDYIMQQMGIRRRSYRREKTPESMNSIEELGFTPETNIAFAIDVDEYMDVSELAKQCPRGVSQSFGIDDGWQTLSHVEGDTFHSAKQSSLRRILQCCGRKRHALAEFKMEREKRRRADELCSIVRRCHEHSIDFYLCTLHPLQDACCVLFAYYSGHIQFDRIVSIDAGQRIEIEGRRVLHFGRQGTIPIEYLGLSIQSYIAAAGRRNTDG